MIAEAKTHRQEKLPTVPTHLATFARNVPPRERKKRVTGASIDTNQIFVYKTNRHSSFSFVSVVTNANLVAKLARLPPNNAPH